MSEVDLCKSVRPCPICGGHQVEMLQHLEYEQFLQSLPASYDIVSCQKCGMVFNDTSAAAADFDRYYAAFSKYEGQNLIGAGDFSAVERGRYERLHNFVAPHLQKENRIVEVGCGQGGFLRFLSEKGYANLLGIDPSSNCVEILRRNKIPAVNGTLEQSPSVNKFDFLALIGVAEHLFSPVQSLNGFLQRCGAPPWLFLVVPSTRDYGAQISTPFYHFDFEHLSHFDIHQLNNLLAACGYKLAKYAYDFISVGEVSNGTINALYQKVDQPEDIRFNDEALVAVKHYIENSRKNDLDAKVDRLLQKNRPLYLWGCGAHLARLLRKTALAQGNIIAFVDNDPHKQTLTLLGRRIIPSQQLHGLGKENTVVICSPLYKTVMREELHENDFQGQVEMIC